jgi:hypothetical protein
VLSRVAVEVFEPDQQDAYVRWTYDNPQGFVLVKVGGGRFRLHCAMCEAIFWGMGGRVAGHRRYCSPDERELRRVSISESGKPPLTCEQCRS